MFKKNFKVIELRDNGIKVTHYMRGTKKALKKDIEMYKNNSKDYEFIGKEGMIVWC